MMIQRIQTTSFGNSLPVAGIKEEIQQIQDKKDDFVNATIGTGGALAIAKGNQALKAVSGLSSKSKNILGHVAQNKNAIQKWLTKIITSTETINGLKWVGKMAKSPAIKKIGGVFGGVGAAAICVTEFSNMATVGSNLCDGKTRFSILDSFGK